MKIVCLIYNCVIYIWGVFQNNTLKIYFYFTYFEFDKKKSYPQILKEIIKTLRLESYIRQGDLQLYDWPWKTIWGKDIN